MKKISFILLLTLCSLIGFGQQFRTGNAPMKSVNTKMSQVKQSNAQNTAKAALNGNFVATDINGVEHNLQTYLDAGKTVIIDFFGYWCGPCWSLHQAGVLEDFYNTYGPAGTDEAVVLMVESTSDCTLALLQGTGTGQGGATQGNWTATAGGANQVPIIIDGAADTYNTVFGDVTDGYVPNVVMVCPSGYTLLLSSYSSYSTAAAIHANFGSCIDETDLAIASIAGPATAAMGESVTFESLVETVAPITAYAWTINGGTPATATTEDATATFAAEGTYTITLEVTNANGTTTATHEITILDCTNGITVFPHTENFAYTTMPACWTSTSNNTENTPFIAEVAAEGDYAYIFTSYDDATDYNQYLITPLLTTTNQLQFAFDYAVAHEDSGGEDFKVGYSTTTNDISAFTWGETISAQYGTGFENYTNIFPAGVKYFAINYFSDWQYYLAIDNIVISEITNPLLYAVPTTINFNGIFGSTFSPVVVNVTAALLTDPINVTTVAPFSVSSDNVTYGTTATLPTTGGTLYVKYTPTVAGTDNGTVVLSTTGVTNVTITVTGTAADCPVNTLPFTEDFEDALSPCWINLDDDGDGYTWNNDLAFDGHNGSCFSSASYVNYVGALTPDNWLISPKIQLTTDILFTFWMAAQDSGYPAEKYGVFVSTTGTAPADFTQLFVETMNANGGSTGNAKDQTPWVMKTVDLSAYENQEVYIAWRHFDCTDAYFLNLDDISIISSPISINENMNNNVNIYPNPSTGLVNISVSEFSNVEIYDITGKMIDNFSINANETHSFTQSAGMYIVKINNEVQKIVIE